jgi:DNA-binding NtrC family response regulator
MALVYTILVVDDDHQLLDVVAAVLAEPGYVVLTASDGYEAIRTLAARHVDMLIADVRMPGLDGPQLCVQAKLMRPRLRLILMSGYPQAADARTASLGGVLLRKPVRAVELLETVEAEIARN